MPKPEITIESVHASYIENADFEEACDVAKARAFITAIRRMISFAQTSSNQSSSMSFDLAALQRERQRAEAFIATAANSGGENGEASPGEFNCFGFVGYERLGQFR